MRLRHLALPAAAGLALFAIPFAPAAQAFTTGCSAADNSCTAVYETTGAPEDFTVPAGVTQLIIAAYGGSGGSGFPQQQPPADAARAGTGAHAAVAARAANGATDGGDGGSLLAQVAVTPGENLTIVAGGKGSDAHQDATDAPGGYGGGGTSPTVSDGSDGAGGGGSFLFRGDTLLLAVGGGGGGGFVDGGDGGTGGAGAAGTDGGDATLGGKAATTSAAGAGGGGTDSNAGTGPATSRTAFGNGGVATQDPAFGGCSAGGGGGGYYGGGSGGCSRTDGVYADGGGGGGSGYVAPGVETLATGTNTGDGGFVIGYTTAATTTTLSSDVTTLAPGQEATIDATVDGPELTIAGADSSAAAEAAVTKVAAAHGAGFAAAAKPAKANAAAAVLPGGTVINPGTACGTTGCTVTFFVNGKQLADPISVDPATGVATVIFTAGSEEGVREITARYDGNLYYLQSTSDPLAITVSGLANTGPANVAPLLVTSTLLLAAGAGLVAFGRRRPQLGSHRAV